MKALCIAVLFPTFLIGDSVVVSWQPNTESDLAGYQIYYGSSSNFYSTILDIGKVTQYTVSGLNTGNTYFFAVTAYDINGNESAYSQEVSYRVEDVTPPAVVSVTCEMGDRLKVVFSEPVEKASAELISNYSINYGIVVQNAVLQTDLKTVYLYTTLQPNRYYILTINNVRDRATVPNSIAPNTTKEYLWEGGDVQPPTIVSASLNNTNNYLTITFSEAVNVTSALAISNYSISPSVQILSSAIDATCIYVTLATAAHAPGQTYTLTVNNVKDAASIPNTIAANTQKTYTCTSGDAVPPTLVAVRFSSSSSTQLQVEFNEKLDAGSAQNAANYTISPSVRVLNATLNSDKTIVTLNTDSHPAGTYTLTVRNVGDANTPPNIMQSGQLTYAYTPPDVTPPTLVQANLESNNHLKITFSEPVDQASAESISNYGITPTVTINQAQLYADLKTLDLQTAPHAAGTYTVRVNGVKDLASIPNVMSGTNPNSSRTYTWAPGDVNPPVLVSASLFGANLVELIFDEPLDRTSVETVSHYAIDKGITVSSAALVGDNFDHVQLNTSSHQQGQTYTVTVSGIRDRATVPNTCGSLTKTYTYPVTDTTPPRLISAALQGGNQSLELEFSEPLDQTSAETPGNYIITDGVQVSQATLNWSRNKVTLKTSAHTAGKSYTVTVINVKDLSSPGNVVSSAENKKIYSCTSEDVYPPQLVRTDVLHDDELELTFNEPLNIQSAETVSNYSITSGITVNEARISSADQKYVRLTTSRHQRGNYTITVTGVKDLAAPTPNMLSRAQLQYSYQPPDTTAPKLLSATSQNEYRIDLQFDEPLDRSSSVDVGHYSITGGVAVEEAELDVTMTKVILTTTRQYPGSSYTITVNDVRDASGNANVIQPTHQDFIYSTKDFKSPEIVRAETSGDQMLVVTFSEPLNRETAVKTENYKINNNILVSNAFLTTYDSQVFLQTSKHTAGEYTLTVNSVQDASPQKNPIVAYSQIKYVYNPRDTVGPSLVDAKLQPSNENNVLKLVFDEYVDAVESSKPENYVITPGPMAVRTAVLNGLDPTTVVLITDSHQKGTYTVTVSKVTDRSNNPKPNPIGAHNIMQYTCLPPDTVAPHLTSAGLLEKSSQVVVVTFDEEVDRQTAENISNYSIVPNIVINHAYLLASRQMVHLETASHEAKVPYVLRVNGIKDRAPSPNTMTKAESWPYTYAPPDTTPPKLLDAKLSGPTMLELAFSEPLERSSAENRDNYRIDPSVEVLNVQYDASTMKRVYLETTQHMPGMMYGVNVKNVRDQSSIPISPATWFNYSLSGPGTSGATDKTPPSLVRVDMVSSTRVDLVFSEPLDKESAENTSHYVIQDSVTVQSAKADSDLVKVHLTTTAHRIGKSYRIYVKNISDRAAKPNLMAVSPTIQYILAKGVSISNPSQASYILSLFDLNERGYFDRDYTLTQAPDYLKGSAQILTSNDDKTAVADDFLRFELRGEATVYVAYDKRVADPPDWLANWKATGDQIMDSRSVAYQLFSKRSTGGRIILGGNKGNMDDNMYMVFAVPHMANGMLLAKLNRPSYDVSEVGVGDAYYVDRDYTVSSVSDSMDECLWIRTANDDKMNRDATFLSFELMLKSEIYVAYDSKIATLPKWLVGWESTGLQVVDSRGTRFDLHKKTYDAGGVNFGGNCGSSDDNMYFVLLKPLEGQSDPGVSELPGYFSLTQNYPNPFNPKTTIHFAVHKNGRIKITVFNLLGQSVKVLVDGDFEAGHSGNTVWDGTDHNGRQVSSGMYFYRIEQDHFAKTRRMLLLR